MMGILTACGSSQSSLSNRDEEVQRCRFDTIEEVREKVDDEKFYSLIEKVYEKGGFHLLGYADQGFRVMSMNKKFSPYRILKDRR